jgi:hypothetical protein
MIEFVQASATIQSATTVDEATAAFKVGLAGLGFNWFAYLGLRVPGIDELIWQSSYPEEWTSHYLEMKYQDIDPVVTRSASTMIPFQWGMFQMRELKGMRRKLFSEAKSQHIEVGLTVPVHAPNRSFLLDIGRRH